MASIHSMENYIKEKEQKGLKILWLVTLARWVLAPNQNRGEIVREKHKEDKKIVSFAKIARLG